MIIIIYINRIDFAGNRIMINIVWRDTGGRVGDSCDQECGEESDMSQKYAKSSKVQACHQPYFQAFVRHTPVRKWLRY